MKKLFMIPKDYIADDCVQVMLTCEEFNNLNVFKGEDGVMVRYEDDPRRHLFPYNTIPKHFEYRFFHKRKCINAILNLGEVYRIITGARGLKFLDDNLSNYQEYSYKIKDYYAKALLYYGNAVLYINDKYEEVEKFKAENLENKRIKRINVPKIKAEVNDLTEEEVDNAKHINRLKALKLKHKEELELLRKKYDELYEDSKQKKLRLLNRHS